MNKSIAYFITPIIYDALCMMQSNFRKKVGQWIILV